MDAYLGECEWLCPDCAEGVDGLEGPYPDGGGEADCPQHCAACGIPLENPLTSDGVTYVLDAIRESTADTAENRNTIRQAIPDQPNWYDGSPRCAVVRDWANQILYYGLDDQDRDLVNNYLELTSK